MKPRASARFLADRTGASALEFALVAPILFVMLFAILQLGWAYHCAGSVQYALQRASRTVVLDPNADEQDVRDAMSDFLNDVARNDFTLELEDMTINGTPFARMTANYQHVVNIPFVQPFTVHFTNVELAARPDENEAED